MHRSDGRPLEVGVRRQMEGRFTHDFGRVRIHTGVQAADAARAAGAVAYTVGRDIVFAAGQYRPGTTAGDRIIAHELAHVVQQTGEVGSAVPTAPTPANAGPLESEARMTGDTVGSGGRARVIGRAVVGVQHLEPVRSSLDLDPQQILKIVREAKDLNDMKLRLGLGPVTDQALVRYLITHAPGPTPRTPDADPGPAASVTPKDQWIIGRVIVSPHPSGEGFVNHYERGNAAELAQLQADENERAARMQLEGLAFALGETRTGSATPTVPPRAGAATGPARTYERRLGAYKPPAPTYGGYGPQLPENNSQMNAPKIRTGEVKSEVSKKAAESKTLSVWAAEVPDGAYVGYATYDGHGNISLDIHLAGGNQDRVWHNENIGHIAPAELPKMKYGTKEFGDAMEGPLVRYVGQYLGQSFEVKAPSAVGPDFVPQRPRMRFNLLKKK